MNKYIVFDTETGGLTSETSLLTAYFAVLDAEFNVVDELDLRLIPDNGIYFVDPKALEVNKIDLAELGKVAIPYKEAKTILYKFLQKNAGEEKLIPIGQNVQFDIVRVTTDLISAGSWENFVSRRVLDTMIIAQFLVQIGKIEPEGIGLGKLIEYFNVTVEGNAHEARYDALATAKVYQEMIRVVDQCDCPKQSPYVQPFGVGML